MTYIFFSWVEPWMCTESTNKDTQREHPQIETHRERYIHTDTHTHSHTYTEDDNQRESIVFGKRRKVTEERSKRDGA